jgi:hypothetical protein
VNSCNGGASGAGKRFRVAKDMRTLPLLEIKILSGDNEVENLPQPNVNLTVLIA